MTDVEGSTRLWDADPEAMADALARHDQIVEASVAATDGVFVKSRGEGDSTFSVFERAQDAVVAALRVRDELDTTVWPLAEPLVVRSAVHTGTALARDGDYFGPTVNRAARIRALAVGGQILLSEATAEFVRDELPASCELVDLGTYELRGLSEPERVYAVAEPGTPRRAITPGVCPYQGLLAFELANHDRYFGREALVVSLRDRLMATGRVVVVGASGSGKSSLVRAGLVAALPADVEHLLMSPGPAPLDELAAAIAARGGANEHHIRGLLETDPRAALRAVTSKRLVVVVDQLEELFTVCTDDDQRRIFLDVLIACGSGSSSTGLVVALRGDFYGQFAQHLGFAGLISSENELLGPMSMDDLRVVIEQPARGSGLKLESGLVDTILGDVEGEPGALPLVSHALRETWRRREGNTLTLAGYHAAGGVRGAIARTADTIYDSLVPEEQRTMRGIFVRLTELGEGVEDTRRRASVREIAGVDRGDATEVLEILVDARLVTIGTDTVEVAHEALIREWPRLRGWLDEDREGLRLLRDLGRAADDWSSLARDPGALYRGARLASTLQWLASDPSIELNAHEQQFLDASRAAQEAEVVATEARLREETMANQRLRRRLVAIAVTLALAVAAGGLAFVQRNRADDEAARARSATTTADVARLVAESEVLRLRDRPLSALLAVAAYELADTPATRGGLQSTLASEPRLRGTMFGASDPYRSIAFTPDGRTLVVRGRSGVDFFDARQRRREGPSLDLDGFGGSLALSADGRLFATGGDDGTVTVWDARTHRKVDETPSVGAPVTTLSFSPDGSRIAVASGEFGEQTSDIGTTATVFDIDSGAPVLRPVSGHTRSVFVVGYSPDGRVLATGGNDGLVVLHDATSGVPIAPIIDVGAEVYSLAFSPDGSRLAVGSQGSDVLVFAVATGEAVGPRLATDGLLGTVAFSADGQRLVTVAQQAMVWDTTSFTRIGAPIDPGQSSVAVAYSPIADEFAIAGFDGSVSIWDPDALPLFSRLLSDTSSLGGVFSPNGRVVALPSTTDVTLYDARTREALGPPLAVPSGQALTVGITPVTVAFSRDSARLAIAGLGAIIRVFDTATLKPVGADVPVSSPPASLAFSPDGRTLAAGGIQGDVSLVDLATGSVRGPLSPSPSNFVLTVTFNEDGTRLVATSSVGDALVYEDLDAASPDSRPLPGDQDVIAAAFSPDGALLATAGTGGVVQLRDATTLRPLGVPIRAGSGIVFDLVFSPDSRLLAVVDIDLAVRFVDVAARTPVGDALNIGTFGRVSFAHGASTAVLPANGGTALMTLSAERWRARACQLAGRDLTTGERRQYLHGENRLRAVCT